MADNKQYVTHVQENGRILVSEDVISAISVQALTDIEGYAGLDVKPGADIVELIGKSGWGKGVKVFITDNGEITVECNVIVYFGSSVVTVAAAIQEAVGSAVRAMVGVDDVNVNVNVCGIIRQ